MGRFLTSVATNTTDLSPSLQAGTPKQLDTGKPRACYAMLSYNTATTWCGATFYDKFFQPVVANTYDDGTSSAIAGNNSYVSGGTLQAMLQVFNGATPTQNYPTTGATNSYMNATNAAGELGNAMVDVYSNSTLSRTQSRSSNWNIKHYTNSYVVNSNHQDKSVVYVMVGGTFRAISRIDGDYSYNRRGTLHYAISGVSSSMWGTASYNRNRKELVILSYVGTGGTFKLVTYRGIDFDMYPSPHLAFTASGVTRTDIASFTLGATWPVNDNESYYNIKPVLTDDGTIFTTVMFSNNSFSIYKTVRSSDATTIVSSAYLAGYSLAGTAYGKGTDIYYGQRVISSRDGNAVIAFCQYYYYGAGIYSYVIDRTNNTYYQPTFLNSADTTYGYIPVPYGDDGFAVFYCGNGYSGNYNGNYVTGICGRNGTGLFEQSGTNIYMPYHTGPNTTNYPGFTQVTDYAMLTNQNVI